MEDKAIRWSVPFKFKLKIKLLKTEFIAKITYTATNKKEIWPIFGLNLKIFSNLLIKNSTLFNRFFIFDSKRQ